MTLRDYVIALYIRLSANDKKVESNSIENQRLLLTKYAENMEIQNIKLLEFVDNGYSGTNFERPAIQELLELVKSYQVNCIMVKDFSRFGRNIIKTGYFLEQVFPLYHIRFVSVTENYDSDKTKNNAGGIPVTIQFLKNELYNRKIVTPERYKKEKRRQKIALYSPYIWCATTIKNILLNEQYIGTYIMRKTVIKELGEKSTKREEKDWIKIPNHHEAIIEKEVFKQIQKQLFHFKIKDTKQREYFLKGKIYCGYCSHAMQRSRHKYPILFCRHSEVDTSFPCYHLKIEEKEVEEIVFQMILKQIEIIKDTKQTSNIEIQTAQKIELQNQIQLYHKKKEILYEQYIKGKLTEEQFIKINLELTKELEPIQNKLEEIDFQLKHSQNKNILQNQIKDIIKDTPFLLNKELVDFFIDKIYIFKENRIEVKWKIEDFLQKRQ